MKPLTFNAVTRGFLRSRNVMFIGSLIPHRYFELNTIAAKGLVSLLSWNQFLLKSSAVIVDSEKELYDPSTFVSIVTDRWTSLVADPPEGYEQGINNLHRRVIGTGGCLAHGVGPWSMMRKQV